MKTSTNGISDAIFEYYTNPYSEQAVLIDGDWGEGKTYFLTKVLPRILASKLCDSSPLLPDTPLPIEIRCISLFGLSTESQIERRLCARLDESENTKKGLFETIKEVGRSCSSSFDIDDGRVGGNLGGIGATISLLDEIILQRHLKKVITGGALICIDDLERWLGDIRVPLAFISRLVEQYNAKVLIVCNTNKLDPTEEDATVKNNNKTGKNTSLFNEFKEKVIGQTLKFSLSYDEKFQVLESWYLRDKDIAKLFSNMILLRSGSQEPILIKSENLRRLRQSFTAFYSFYQRYTEYMHLSTRLACALWEGLESCPLSLQKKSNLNRDFSKAACIYLKKGIFCDEIDNIFSERDSYSPHLQAMCDIRNQTIFLSQPQKDLEAAIEGALLAIEVSNTLDIKELFLTFTALVYYSEKEYLKHQINTYLKKFQNALKASNAAPNKKGEDLNKAISYLEHNLFQLQRPNPKISYNSVFFEADFSTISPDTHSSSILCKWIGSILKWTDKIPKSNELEDIWSNFFSSNVPQLATNYSRPIGLWNNCYSNWHKYLHDIPKHKIHVLIKIIQCLENHYYDDHNFIYVLYTACIDMSQILRCRMVKGDPSMRFYIEQVNALSKEIEERILERFGHLDPMK